MSFISWNDKFAIGIEAIDNDHKSLFDISEQLHEAYASGRSAEALDQLFKVLFDYVENHFRREEGVMERCGYPDLEAHRASHAALTEQVTDLYQRFKRGDEKVGDTGICLEILGFLKNWLHFHILDEDMDIRDFINSKG